MSNNRRCPHCNCSTDTIKFGMTNANRQRYHCGMCGKTWTNSYRKNRLAKLIWHDLVWNNLPVRELSNKYKLHPNTIRNIIHNYQPDPINLNNMPSEDRAKITVIIMDTTYFGRKHGVVVAINAHNGKLLYFKEILGSETNKDYKDCIETLLAAGIKPKACVIDGRKGVRDMLDDYGILVQLCHFHLKLMVRKYITNSPVLEPNILLKAVVDTLCDSRFPAVTEHQFYGYFAGWHHKYRLWLNEKTYNPNTGTREWTHQDTRRAFTAIKNHLDVLFTYEQHPELNIPKTSNRIEGLFGMAKDKLRIHHGYTNELKIKIFFSLLSGK